MINKNGKHYCLKCWFCGSKIDGSAINRKIDDSIILPLCNSCTHYLKEKHKIRSKSHD